MAEKKSNGCAIAATVVGVMTLLVVAALVLGLRGCYSALEGVSEEAREAQRAARERAWEVGNPPKDGMIVFDQDDLPEPKPHRKGEPLARQNWLAWSLDDRATEFAREAFREAADGSPVDWMLRTEEVSAVGGGGARGRFGLPVRIEQRERNSLTTTDRSISVVVEFGEDERDRLMTVRRQDWVRVAGVLELKDGGELRIVDARIVDDNDPPVER